MSAAIESVQADSLPFPGRGSLQRRVLALAAPTIGENLLQTLVGIVDTLLVARLGAEALAGVGSSLQVMFLVISVLSTISVGASILVSQAIGAGKHERANQVARQALVWGIVLSVPLSIGGYLLAESIASWMGLPSEVAAITAAYIQVTLSGSIFLVLMYVAGGVLRGAGDARTPMLAAMVANILNAGLAWLLIFGNLGLPALGTQGSAWAALIGRAVATALLLVALCSGLRVINVWGTHGWRPDGMLARRMLGLGGPAALEQALITLGFTVFTALMASQGTAALAGQRITMNALSLAFLPAIGLMLATTALVGMSVGARALRHGAAATGVAARWGVGWMTLIGGTYLVLAEPVVRLFSEDGTVVADGVSMLRLIALAQPAWALVFIYSGALRGTGDTRYPLLVNTTMVWLVVAAAAVLVHGLNTGPLLPWSGFVITAPASAYLVWRRFRAVVREDAALTRPLRAEHPAKTAGDGAAA